MTRDYLPLPSGTLSHGASFHKPSQTAPQRVTLESPAVDVMTDLVRVVPETIAPSATVDEANQAMIRRGVRLLLVINESQIILGLITARDVLGEKPMQIIQARGGTRQDVTVRDIMSPQEKLEVIAFEDVLAGKVGSVVATLKKSGRQHALVVEQSRETNTQVVRGIFSLSQIARQLGTPIHTTEIAKTFAEIEASLAS